MSSGGKKIVDGLKEVHAALDGDLDAIGKMRVTPSCGLRFLRSQSHPGCGWYAQVKAPRGQVPKGDGMSCSKRDTQWDQAGHRPGN